MPESAIPKHVLDRDWKGTDNDSWLMRLKKKLQYLVAAGPNVPSGFWKWREIPIRLFQYSSDASMLRWENTDGSITVKDFDRVIFKGPFYLSRIQPWTRWHASLQWPLFFNCHFIYRQKNVAVYPTYQSSFGITKMFTFGIGFKRDSDRIYWLTANGFGNFE